MNRRGGEAVQEKNKEIQQLPYRRAVKCAAGGLKI